MSSQPVDFESPRRPKTRSILRGLARSLAALLLGSLAVGAVGCDSRRGPPSAWRDVSLEQQPPIFERRHGQPALADLDGIYLGQTADAAKSALREYCEHFMRREAGLLEGEAHFLGCRVEDDSPLKFVRVGFWPRLDGRVATLEIKRMSLRPPGVYGAFRRFFDSEPRREILRARMVQVQLRHYRLFADWDEGLQGPAHVTIGFDPEIPKDRTMPDR